ncbi:SspB family protein [Aestuariivirga litoralis]|uniref:SspB family protein n=1 Tax=Aestuariivirga litoralis TaxID=2650924 RepID=UPI0018C656E8|nr:ClpXP protease specificity-enhancing factor SspB [Aestuariivirga litoralis]MBG1231179.1 hypothetical protein [Aestuariivirga litoralis]
MPEDLMRYDQLAQNALRGVVRDALRKVERSGLPGEHHFFIQFNTRFAGVSIGERLHAKYPREMTVVLQHQYYNLAVYDDRFEVELSFDNIPEKLIIPFASVKGFLDPAVQFGLQFEVVEEAEKPAAEEKATTKRAAKSEAAKDKDATASEAKPEGETETEPASEEQKVVSLDAFRKK